MTAIFVAGSKAEMFHYHDKPGVCRGESETRCDYDLRLLQNRLVNMLKYIMGPLVFKAQKCIPIKYLTVVT